MPEMRQSIEHLGSELDMQDDLVREINVRLEPAMLPPEPGPESVKGEDRSRSEYSHAIRMAASRVNRVNQTLRDVLNRLEV